MVLVLLLAGCQAGPGPRTDGAPAPEPPTSAELIDMPSYSDAGFRGLVRKYTRAGGEAVDYDAWHADPEDRAALDDYIALIAAVSPENAPDQFTDRAAERSYWINAYNALVLQAVLELWPLDSVRDVTVSFSSRLIPGKGFFYDRKVTVGGRETNLYDLEKQVLRSQKDPRLHFALNCASESCPVLRPWEWTDAQLDEAAREFVNTPENVTVEDGALYVSKIFKWYRRDFPDDLHEYLAGYAEPGLAAALRSARDDGLPLRYRDYDWSLNVDGAAAERRGDGS